VKIAIVGAGVSGLTAGYLLSDYHDVTIFEREEWLGGHAHTVRVAGGDGDYDVDTGFLVFNDATYPNFISLLERLKVASIESTMSFSYHDARSALEWKGTNLNTIFAQRRNIFKWRFVRMVWEIMSFNRTLRTLLKSDIADDLTLRDILRQRKWSAAFSDWYLIPMGAAIWSADPSTFDEIPLRTFSEFFSRHGLLSVRGRPVWRTILGGSKTYVERIVAKISEQGLVRSSSPVLEVRRDGDTVKVVTKDESLLFDHVVLACHSDEALALLSDPTDVEKEVLGALRYQSNEVTLHWDTSLLPTQKRAWAAWNYRRESDDATLATLTYDISALQSLRAPREFLVSLNSDHLINPDKVLSRFRYSHPVLDHAAVGAQRRRHELNTERTSFCGAYFGYGFHEDGVRSALEVCETLGVSW
jgi:predicted NAD/FAD-binding protein